MSESIRRSASAITESHVTVKRTARYYQIGEAGPHINDIWYVLHGYGQLASYFIKNFQNLAADDRLIVAPEGLSRFYLEGPPRRVGATWMTREDRLNEIEDYLQYLTELHQRIAKSSNNAVRTTVLGFSQGTATACRWVFTTALEPQHLILWAGGIPPELTLSDYNTLFSTMRMTIVLGTEDEFITPEMLQGETTKLDAEKVPYQLVEFAGKHRIHQETLWNLASNAPCS